MTTYDSEAVSPHDDWFIALWPDGTWCDWNERETYLTFMSDDYEKHRVITYDGNGYCPLKTERVS